MQSAGVAARVDTIEGCSLSVALLGDRKDLTISLERCRSAMELMQLCSEIGPANRRTRLNMAVS
jgi:hypothetical protein